MNKINANNISGLIKAGLNFLLKMLKSMFKHQKSCCKVVLFIFTMLMHSNTNGQKMMTLKVILDSSFIYSPSLKAANSTIEQQQQLVKSSINLPPPEILVQNPTGQFYTIGVQQIFDFPTIYVAQKKIQKENVKLAETERKLTQSDVKYQVSILYSELQYQLELVKLLKRQDSAYQKIAENAERAFNAGNIDFIQASYSKVQAGQVKSNLILAEANYKSILENLKILCNIKSDFLPDSIVVYEEKMIFEGDTGISQNSSMLYVRQQIAINERKLQLEKQKTLPGFTVAFLNQGNKTTINQNRFYAGLRIPLWFWQYKGNIEAARSKVDVSRYNADANSLRLATEMQSAYTKYVAYRQALGLYRSDILQQVGSLTNASNRFFASGNTSYTDFLRNLNDISEIRKNYLLTVKNFNQTIIYIDYLTGNL